jgi:hypothetical protein
MQELLNVKAAGTYSDHSALKVKGNSCEIRVQLESGLFRQQFCHLFCNFGVYYIRVFGAA